MKYKNYKNPYTQEDSIYSRNNMLDMSLRELISRKDEILAQTRVLGIPEDKELSGSENAVYVEAYTRDDGTEVKSHWRSKPNNTLSDNYSLKKNSGFPTGGASKIEREKEEIAINKLSKNNDEFFEKERSNPQSWLMRINAERNSDRPTAKLFMDIALVNPKRVPSTQDYQYLTKEEGQIFNKKYKLTGNKEIPSSYDGFRFSKDSPTAQELNNSQELKNQIFADKNYDSRTGTFKRDKLEIEFKNDKNLQYSFGHMTVLNPKIENDYITGLAFDKYDFEEMYGKNFKDVSKEIKDLNNKAYSLQSLGHLKNYYIFVPINMCVK